MRDLTKYTVLEMLAESRRHLDAVAVLQDRVEAMSEEIGKHLDFVKALNKELNRRTSGDAVND